MTISILNLDSSNDVDVTTLRCAPKTDFVVINTDEPKTGAREATYQRKTGDKEYPMTARQGIYVKPDANDGVGQTNASLKIGTFVQKTDPDDDVLWTLPLTVTIAISGPGTSAVAVNDGVQELLEYAFSMLVNTDTGVLSDDALSELAFGIVNGLCAHVDSGTV
jgi:hypothetical protein